MLETESDAIRADEWNDLIADLPGAHILQTWEWGQVKSDFGWQPIHRVWRSPSGQLEAAALVLERRIKVPGLPGGLGVMYAPKGPMLDWGDKAC